MIASPATVLNTPISTANTVTQMGLNSAVELTRFEGHQGWVVGVAFHPNSKLVASSGADRTVRLWDSNTGQEIHRLRGHGDVVGGVAFNKDGSLLASAASDGTVRLWDPASGEERRVLITPGFDQAYAAAFSPSDLLAVAGRGEVQLWDPISGEPLQSLPAFRGDAYGLAFSPDGGRLIFVDPAGRLACYERQR